MQIQIFHKLLFSFCWYVIICLVPLQVLSQQVIPLYEGPIPGAISTKITEEKDMFLGKIPVVKNVINPHLPFFLLPKKLPRAQQL